MNIPQDLRYSENHEWARLEEGGSVRVGITDYAQDALGDVVYVDLPAVGRAIDAGEAFSEVESTKSVAEVYSPVTGTIAEVNQALATAPEAVNHDPYGGGWFVVVTPEEGAGLDHLMDAAAYAAFTE